MTLELTDKNADELLNQESTVVIKCWATWCGPCRSYGPMFDKASEDPELSGYTFLTLDVDNNPEITSKLGVRSLPTTVVMAACNEIGRFSGVKSESDIVDYLKSL